MKTITVIGAAAVAIGFFVTGAVAQHEEHHQDQTGAPTVSAPRNAEGMKSGNMMSQMQEMKGQMPAMMKGQDETEKLVDRLMKSYAAIEVEKNSSARRNKLAAHGMLLRELQTEVQAQSHKMEMMQRMMTGSMMDGKKMGEMPKDEHKQ